MPKVKQELSVDSLRHAEYYGMQQIYDDLYTKSKNGEPFSGLMDIILSRENILLAYRNIKANTGSNTPGTDRLTIKDIGCLSTEEIVDQVRRIVNGKRGALADLERRQLIEKRQRHRANGSLTSNLYRLTAAKKSQSPAKGGL